MADDELILWLRLSLITGLGARSQIQLLRALGEPAAIFAAPIEILAPYVGLSLAQAIHAASDSQQIANSLLWREQEKCTILTLADECYPKALLDLPDPPAVLYAQGDLSLLDNAGLSIVGSRSATVQGVQNAQAFAQHLSAQNITIVSGLASGIDAAAHRGGLLESGSSIAVVGTGLDRVYPASNRALAHELAASGLLLSEFVIGSPPKAEHFPRRNRLIAALGLGCLVVEAALESGSLITARQAVDIGREVFAIPGSIHSPVAKGCHSLIKKGAKLVESAADIVDELEPQLARFQRHLAMKAAIEPETVQAGQLHPILDLIGWEIAEFDWLIVQTGLTSEALCAILLGLELEGQLASLPGNRYQRLAVAV